jgi:uracil phosphoribosyltransferase
MERRQARTDSMTAGPASRGNPVGKVTVIDHPLVQHKLSLMRSRETSTSDFRRLLKEVSMLMAYEATRDLPMTTDEIETPMAPMDAPVLDGKKLVVVSILRAGNGILDGILDIVPSARVGFVGLYRDHETLEAVQYYLKLPENMDDRRVLLVDPMLATGHSSVAATDRVAAAGPKSMKFLCLLAAPEGIEHFHEHHPDVEIITAAIDSHLDENGYIIPGLGDAGDRIFGTK